MKKLLVVLLAMIMVFSFAACGGGGGEESAGDPNVISVENYEAEIVGWEIVKDSDDKDAIAVTFNWTNNGEDSQSFNWAFSFYFYQNGIELDYAVVWVSEDSYDTIDEGLSTNIQPGESLEVIATYELQDLETPVDIEIGDLYQEDVVTKTIDIAE